MSDRTPEARLSRAAWSRLVEGADPQAHRLVSALGPAAALRWLRRAAHDGVLPPTPPDVELGRGHLARSVARWVPRLEHLAPERDLEQVARSGGWFVTPDDAAWPPGLDDLGEDAPFGLWGRGRPESLTGTSVAIVGSRASTSYGMTVGAEIAAGVADAGVVVVSGGAYGIDTAAHRGALAVGGRSVAVMAGGVDRFYPRGSTDMLERLLDDGAVVAEAAPGASPGRHRFLARNRLIAAVTSATVVVEAALRSGALSTARHAAGVGRPLGAVPGPVTSMASAGCHRLLREQDATCVTGYEDVLELALPIGATLVRPGDDEPAASPAGFLDDLDAEQARVLDAMPAVRAADTASIARTAGIDPQDVRAALGLLELAGRVEMSGSGWRRTPGRGAQRERW